MGYQINQVYEENQTFEAQKLVGQAGLIKFDSGQGLALLNIACSLWVKRARDLKFSAW